MSDDELKWTEAQLAERTRLEGEQRLQQARSAAAERARLLEFSSEQLSHNKYARIPVQRMVIEAWREAEDVGRLHAAEKILAQLTDLSQLM